MNKIENKLILSTAIALILISPVLSQNEGLTYENSRLSSELMIVDFTDRDPIHEGQNLNYELDDGWCNCSLANANESNCSGMYRSLAVSRGERGPALQLQYDLGETPDCWVQVICEFNPPLDLSAYDHMRINWTGDDSSANSLEVLLPSVADDNGNRTLAQIVYNHITQKDWPGHLIIPFRSLKSNSGGGPDLKNVEQILISVKNYNNKSDTDPDDTGENGNITIECISVLNIGSRVIPSDFEKVEANEAASRAAAEWLASQQQPTGLLTSWEEEPVSKAHLYDQALALIVFSQEGMWVNADKLVGSLFRLQNEDGSWYKTYNPSDMRNISDNKWIGDIAWTVYALDRYQELGGADPNATIAMENGADWIEGQINSSNGCLLGAPAEGIMDAWWALKAAGRDDGADWLRVCLLDSYWDEELGRFMSGKDDPKPVLDVQTWGASFLKAIGEKETALRALSYAREVLTVSSKDGEVVGLSEQAGPWSVLNEGTGQYIVAGGDGSNYFLQELISQQELNGSMPGSPDDFKGNGIWETRMHGVAPTAWLYFASSDGPFNNSIAS